MLNPDAPFVLRNDRKRFTVQILGGIVLTVLGVVGLVGAGFNPIVLLAVVCGLAIIAVSVWSLRNDAPVMTADHEGVSLQAVRGPDGVRRLTWEQVDAIYVHRISRNFRMLCVRPVDLDAERAWAGPRAPKIDKSVKLTGAPYSANLSAAGLSDEEAFLRLGTLAAGRARVGER